MENQQEGLKVTESGKLILDTVSKELFPVVEQLKDLLIRVQKCRPFLMYSPELEKLEKEYGEVSAKFFAITTKLETPDVLFKDLKKDIEEPMIAYFQYRGAFLQNVDRGEKYVEIIDRTLDRKNQNIQNSRTLVVALIAIIVSII